VKTVRLWITRTIIIALLVVAVIKSPTAFVSALAGVILAVYLIVIWLKWKFWRIISPLNDMSKAVRQTTLSLQKSGNPFFRTEPVKAAQRVLEQNGFTILGTYAAEQLPRTNIILANNEPEGIHALIIDTEYLGTITEYCSKYEDGRTFTCSNTKMPAILPRPDDHPISRLPDLDAQGVLGHFKESRPTTGIYKLKDGEIQSQVEALYHELKVYEIEAIERSINLEAQLLEKFIIDSGWSAIEWHRKQNDVVIVHDKIKDYELISRYEDAIDDEDEQYQKMKHRVESIIKNNPPIEAFKILSQEIPTKAKLKKIHELTEPVLAHVYLKVTQP